MYILVLKMTRASVGQHLYVPFSKVFTPVDIQAEAFFSTPYSSVTGVSLTFGTSSVSNSRLFRILLIPPNVLESNSDIVAVITVGLDNGARSGDSDPRFFISDSNSGLGFQMREESTGNRCQGAQATMGNVLASNVLITGATHTSSILPEAFVLTFKPREKFGSCYTSIDSGVISPVQYTRTLFLNRGLWLEVYRENPWEQYTFNYIKVEIHEQ